MSDERAETGENPTLEEAEALLFDAASVFSSTTERNRFLSYACRGEPEMLRRIRSLLALYSVSDDFFEFEPQFVSGNLQSDRSDEEGLGVDVGRYRLIERIGSGGCGVVYLAEQREPVRRKVALKIIRLGLETPQSIARFEAERQALASFNHPNIARILDAGTTKSARPYYVMELVDGEALTNFCDSRRLGIRERLELFVKVCQAIQHAHQKGAVHRDIKPANVLVEAHESHPVPKVIDFGIATTEDSLADEFGAQNGADLIGTPTYMSPEQVSGSELVDTRSDIYSLGMLLSELLVGETHQLPEDLMHRNIDEIRRFMLATRPERPSVALAARSPEERSLIAQSRSVREDRLLAWCRHDLDWVVAKAVERDPSRRYDTVDALAADVGRWLHNEPVTARPQTRRYRLAKLVNRNRLWFGAGLLAFVGLAGGLGIATLLFFREKEARAEQENLRVRAEAAHEAEKHARTGWEYRSRVAESAVRLRYRDFAGAEELVAPIPIKETPPSLEAVTVFKSLAEWHRNEGRMQQAECHFLAMAYALSRIDRAHTDSNSDNFLPAASALALSSDSLRYESLRRIALDLYENTAIRIVAERTLKASLLKPAPDAVLERTRKLAKLLEGPEVEAGGTISGNRSLGEWEHFAIALFHYREGDYELAKSVALQGMAKGSRDPSYAPAAKAVLGLALLRQGNRTEAMEHLIAAEGEAGENLRKNPPHGNMSTGFWWDWVNVRILLEEAGWNAHAGWRTVEFPDR